jgi:hypothetical protein
MRIAAVALVALAVVGTTAAATFALQAVDNTKFPDLFAALRGKAVAEVQVGLAQAVAAAERSCGGKAAAVALSGAGAAATWEVSAFVGATGHVVKVNATTGAVESDVPAPAIVLPGAPLAGEPHQSTSGLVWYDLKVGAGEEPAGPTTRVKVHYSGWTLDGRPFDSTVERGQPAAFALNGVIAGWSEGLATMRVGGKRKLVIPARLAWGRQPPQGSGIPVEGVVVCDFELLEIVGK